MDWLNLIALVVTFLLLKYGSKIAEVLRTAQDFRDYRNGYRWAAGDLLRNKETPRSIEEKIFHNTQFDRGARDATEAWLVATGREDDRI